jgi:hypothetical protein
MKPLKTALFAVPALTLVAVLGLSSVAHAEVRKEGAWPTGEPTVSFSLENTPRKVALRQLAGAAGWSLVLPTGLDDSIDLVVRDQPPERVLGFLLEGQSYVAKREGNLVNIRVDHAPSAPTPPVAPTPPSPVASPTPPVPPEPPAVVAPDAKAKGKRAGDRTVTGGSARIGAHEIVHDVQVLGGSLDVDGTVTGDIEVFGGAVRVHPGAKVDGDISALGGAVSVEDGAIVKGGVEAFGAVVSRKDTDHAPVGGRPWLTALSEPFSQIGSAISSSALLFVFGAVLLALLTRRMETLRVETAARPMRTFALGVVGSLGAAVLLLAMGITIIGIPLALAGAVVAVVLAYAGICAVLQTAGEALLRHRTENPYVHLALGCVLFLIAGSLPIVGSYLTAIVVLLGVGTLVATRLGREPGDRRVEEGAYRTVP